MSLFLQIALGVLVAGGVGLGAWKHHENVVKTNETRMHDQVNANATLSTGNSSNDLDTDMATIDAQIKLVDEGSADIEQSLDTQLQQ